MNMRDEVLKLEAQIKANGLRIDDVLRRAKINRSTWTRWKANETIPMLDKWRAVEDAIGESVK